MTGPVTSCVMLSEFLRMGRRMELYVIAGPKWRGQNHLRAGISSQLGPSAQPGPVPTLNFAARWYGLAKAGTIGKPQVGIQK